MNTSACTKCGNSVVKLRSHKRASGDWVFKDERGRIWSSGACPDCKLLQSKNAKLARQQSRAEAEIRNWHIAKGREAERLVAAVIRGCGIKGVKVTQNKGPDITAESRAIEVKSVLKYGSNYFTHMVSEARKGDDLIAIVLPDQSILIQPMRAHLAECRRSGERTMSYLCKGRKS